VIAGPRADLALLALAAEPTSDQALLSGFGAASPEIRAAALDAAPALATRRPELRATLTGRVAALLDSPRWTERQAAARALAAIGGPEAAPHLARATRDPSGFVRAAAVPIRR
jgi:HEAT repeat protein